MESFSTRVDTQWIRRAAAPLAPSLKNSSHHAKRPERKSDVEGSHAVLPQKADDASAISYAILTAADDLSNRQFRGTPVD
jgi:hypothetical protein